MKFKGDKNILRHKTQIKSTFYSKDSEQQKIARVLTTKRFRSKKKTTIPQQNESSIDYLEIENQTHDTNFQFELPSKSPQLPKTTINHTEPYEHETAINNTNDEEDDAGEFDEYDENDFLLSTDSEDSSSIDSDDSNQSDKHHEPEQYFSENTSMLDFSMGIYALKIKHRLSDQATKDIIKFCQIIIPDKKRKNMSLRNLERMFIRDQKGCFRYCCIKCLKLFAKEELLNFSETQKKCPSCSNDLVAFFCFDVKEQIEMILKKEGLRTNTKFEKQRHSKNKQ